MAKLERTYIIPLRREWLKAPKYKRAKKAIAAIKEFIAKHMKSTEIRLSKELNEAVWTRGIKSPPHHIKVNLVKDDEGKVTATLFGVAAKETEKEEKKEAPKEKPKEEKKPSKTATKPKKE